MARGVQTNFLTEHIRLCDCPGLIFPSLVPKRLQVSGTADGVFPFLLTEPSSLACFLSLHQQVLAGEYPVAQVREPYSAIYYL
jgi:hypothetical protein